MGEARGILGLEESPPDGKLLRFNDQDVAIDLGGIAKGYGVDRAVDALRSWGIEMVKRRCFQQAVKVIRNAA